MSRGGLPQPAGRGDGARKRRSGSGTDKQERHASPASDVTLPAVPAQCEGGYCMRIAVTHGKPRRTKPGWLRTPDTVDEVQGARRVMSSFRPERA